MYEVSIHVLSSPSGIKPPIECFPKSMWNIFCGLSVYLSGLHLTTLFDKPLSANSFFMNIENLDAVCEVH